MLRDSSIKPYGSMGLIFITFFTFLCPEVFLPSPGRTISGCPSSLHSTMSSMTVSCCYFLLLFSMALYLHTFLLSSAIRIPALCTLVIRASYTTITYLFVLPRRCPRPSSAPPNILYIL